MKILHFADLHLGVETYGHINPETGLSTRLEDYLIALDQVVDYAISQKIDLVLFCGDAYKSREPSQTQQREFAKRIRRLSEAQIPLFLLIGNHDLPNAIGRATTIEIFDTLSVANVQVANKPGVFQVPTPGGILQVAALPWLRRSALLTKEDTRCLDFAQINQKLQAVLTNIIQEQVAKLDPALPAVLAAHVWVLNASTGSEKSMTIGQEHMLLLSSVAQPAFDYVALGHIHKQQQLADKPPVAYSGSLERLDFGDEDDPKGFYVVEIEAGKPRGERQTRFHFHPIQARRFFTLKISLNPDDPDPTTTVLQAVSACEDQMRNAIVRIHIVLPAALSARLRDYDIRSRVKDAYFLTLSKETVRANRLRMGKGSVEEITPCEALKIFLEAKYAPERARVLLEYGEKLIHEQTNPL